MRSRVKRLLGGLAFAACGLGATALLKRKRRAREGAAKSVNREHGLDKWACPGMSVAFRAELMPGRDRAARTFRVTELLPRGRVRLADFAGEHSEHEFEELR